MSTGIGRAGNMHELVDRLAIEELLHFHSRGLDRCDSGLIKSCYWPEAQVDYGNFKGSAHQFAELVCKALAETYELSQHSLSNILIAMGESKARAETLVTAVHLLKGGEQELCFNGRYLDRLECRDGGWKIIHRQVVMDWSRRSTVADERKSEGFAELCKGRNDERDPSYPFFSGKKR